MSNDMKVIMENWRQANRHQELLQEQLLIEGFLSDLSQVAANVKDMFSVFGSLLKDPQKISRFVSLLAAKVINPTTKSIEKTLIETQKKFNNSEETDKNLVSSLLSKIRNSVNKAYDFVRKIPTGSWRKAVASVGFAVVLNFFSQNVLAGLANIAAGASVEEIVKYFENDIVDFLTQHLGEALVETLTGAITGGISTFVSAVSKIVGGTTFIATTLKPAIEPFQAGKITLTKFEEQLKQKNNLTNNKNVLY